MGPPFELHALTSDRSTDTDGNDVEREIRPSSSGLFDQRPAHLANLKAEQFRLLNGAFVGRDQTAVSRDLERVLIVRRAPERARRGADGALLRPRHCRAGSRRVEADHRLFRMGRDVE